MLEYIIFVGITTWPAFLGPKIKNHFCGTKHFFSGQFDLSGDKVSIIQVPASEADHWPPLGFGKKFNFDLFLNWKTRSIFEMMSICLQIHDMMMISPPASKNRKKDNLLIWCFSLRTKQCNAMCSTHAYWQWWWRSMSA